MGNETSKLSSSPPPSPPPKPTATLTNEPWRNAINWDQSVEHVVEDLKKTFAAEGFDENKSHFFNILLTGILGSGKSSFVNSIFSIFANRMVPIAEAAGSSVQVTKRFRMYTLRHGSEADPLPWRIGDTSGFSTQGESEVSNVLHIVDGHVPEGYEFSVGRKFDYSSPGFIDKPTSSSKVHCVAIVINAYHIQQMPEHGENYDLLKTLRTGLMKRGIPTYVLLTFVDDLCQEVANDLTKVYRSMSVMALVSRASEILMDLPQRNILPVVNYSHEVELEHNKDILLLHAFSQLIGAKERSCKIMKNEITDLVPKAKTGVAVPFYNIFLLGQIGAGKSTFFNGINAIFANRMWTTRAEAGNMATSLTKEFRMYKITDKKNGKVLSTRICDTFGLKEMADDDTDVRNVMSAINGHVPDNYTFTGKEFHEGSAGYIAEPALENKAHCICIAIDAQYVSTMHGNVWRKLRSVFTAVTSRGIPSKILLMKIDLVLGKNESIENIHNNNKVRRVKQDIQKKLCCDIKEEDILPIKNYVEEVEFNVEIDYLLLDSLLHMVMCAQQHLENN